jgi:glycosyltransferase involved in cell wall biosynthesis
MSSRLAVVIPAYRPSAGLVDLVRALAGRVDPIVIIDDGSGPDFAATFRQAAAFPNVQLLRHAVNLGKGAALKTAFNHVLCTMPDVAGIVTADADGQHHPEDIEGVAASLAANPGALVLGARTFGEDVPLRSRFGNVMTRGVMHALLGRKISDTQTGLRGIPASLLPRLLRVESTGYEFELEMLIAAHQLSIPVVERPIRTIYEPGNKSSHFNPIIDSMKIYFVLLRFGSVSLMTALLDNLIFILAVHRFDNVLASQVLGRFFAVIFNYSMVRRSVFDSHQGHKAVLPKYLGLVVASGTCSYLGIQALSKQFGVPVVAAKLLVETVLFFVNFAVQRLFIFRPQESELGVPAPGLRLRLHPFAIAMGVAFLALLSLEIYGFRTGNLFAQEIWYPVGLKRFERYTEFYAVLAAILLLAIPRWFGVVIAGLLVVFTAMSVGPLALLVTAFFLLSAAALGSRLLGPSKEESAQHQLCATLLGTAVYIFVMNCVARLPVNYPAVWGALLAVPVLADLPGVRRRLGWLRTALLPERAPAVSTRLGAALLVYILIAQWFVALKPETSADGLAMHLAIPMNIAAHHALTFQPSRFVWAVMPMGADFAYSIVYLLGGEYAARLLDFAMLLAVAGLLYAVCRRWLSPGASCLIAASFAATPIVQLVTGSLFVENVLAALILAMMAAIWQLEETGNSRYLYAAMALGGAAMSVKFGALAFVAVAVPFALTAGGTRRSVKIAAVLLLLAVAAPPYAIAFAKTADPLFPFLNGRFHSPLLPPGTEIRDYRFHQPFSWRLPYAMTFRTNDYYEGQNGSLGFQYLVLVPLGIAGLFVTRHRVAVSSAVVALGAGLVVMNSEPNARYVYAAIPLLLIPVAALFAWLASHQRAVYGTLVAFLCAATALDAYFLPSASYYHKDFSLRVPFSRVEHEKYLNEAAPVRNVVSYYDRAHADSAVLFTHEAAIAGASGDVYENHWHQLGTWARIREAATPPDMLKLMNELHINYFIAHKPSPGELADPPALAQFLAACTQPEFEAGDFYLARLEPACPPVHLAEPPLAVGPGYYDDYDPAILYRGDWQKLAALHGPDRDTSTHAETPGAEIAIAFEGRELNYIHAMGPDYGIASVTIDGQPKEPLDLYYKDLDWQHKTTFPLPPGRHLAVIRITGEKNPASTGTRVDLDSFDIK